jgi:hypothetical protein
MISRDEYEHKVYPLTVQLPDSFFKCDPLFERHGYGQRCSLAGG